MKSFPIFGILGLIFITLKLAEIGTVATWGWIWVLSPFWLPIALVPVTLMFGAIFLAVWNKLR